MLNLNAVVIDFETRSRCDLKLRAADNYAKDPSTEVLCMAAICLMTGREWLWFPHDGDLPMGLHRAIVEADYIMAHNARFDQGIWEWVAVEEYNFPEIPAEKWYCTMAQARVNALPGALDKAARAINGKYRKDHRGDALIRKLSIPRDDGRFLEDSDLLKAMGEYCLQDVVVTVQLVKETRIMTQEEHQDWLINERINDRGVKIDYDLAEMAMTYAATEQAEIGQLLAEITEGAITKHTQSQRIRDFVLEHAEDPEVERLMTVYKKNEKKYSLARDVRENILNAADAHEIDISDDVYDVIALSDDGNKSSVAKFTRMHGMADDEDGRVRGVFMYAGAGQTKRYSSKGLQLHNFRRECFKPEEAELLKSKMLVGHELDNVMDTLSKMLRPALIPEDDHVFVVGDWSAIEGRILPWLSNERSAEKKLDIFRNDEDVYMVTAKSMGLDDRQIGKVSELSLGYQGAVGAFSSMAKNYGLYLPEHKIVANVKKWRNANPWAPKFWRKLEKAAIDAVCNPGVRYPVGKLTYVYTKQLLEGTLFCILPNGEAIQYPKAKVELQQSDYGTKKVVTYLKASKTAAADAKEWPRGALYGGLQAENATQATAAALLRETLRDVQDLDVVVHVHDEIGVEVHKNSAEQIAERVQYEMEKERDWTKGLPLKAEPEIMWRYGK